MAQTSNRLLDDFARLATDAIGAAQGVRREVETVVKGQIERLLAEMEIARREEVDVLRDMVVAAREENEELRRRVTALGGSRRPAWRGGARPRDPNGRSSAARRSRVVDRAQDRIVSRSRFREIRNPVGSLIRPPYSRGGD